MSAQGDDRGKQIQLEWMRAKWNYEADKWVAWERRQRAAKQEKSDV